MGKKCCAIGCKSGYDSNKSVIPNLTMHKFPLKNAELLKQWLTYLGRPHFVPTKNSVICSLHFNENDFLFERTDMNLSRVKSKSEKLKNRRLKPDALPRPHEKVPKYMLKPKSKPRTGKSTFEERRKTMEVYKKSVEEELRRKDAVENIDQIWEKLKTAKIPTGFEYSKKEASLVFVKINLNECKLPIIDSSVVIDEFMQVKISMNGGFVDPSKYSHICKNVVHYFTEIKNLLSLAADWLANPKSFSWVDMSINYLDKAIAENKDEEQVRKLKFCREQVELTKRHGRALRFSRDLVEFALGIRKISRQACLSGELRRYISLPSDRNIQAHIAKKIRVAKGTEDTYKAAVKEAQKRSKIIPVEDTCALCKRRKSDGDLGRIFGFPALGSEQLQSWEDVLSELDITKEYLDDLEQIRPNFGICWRHFLSSHPSDQSDHLDFAPNIRLWGDEDMGNLSVENMLNEPMKLQDIAQYDDESAVQIQYLEPQNDDVEYYVDIEGTDYVEPFEPTVSYSFESEMLQDKKIMKRRSQKNHKVEKARYYCEYRQEPPVLQGENACKNGSFRIIYPIDDGYE